jgi:FAD/FMN-containing dehydrogenase
MIVVSEKETASDIRALGAQVACEVRTDRVSRVLYSTNASDHQIEPLAVAFPRDVAELAEVIATAAGLGLPALRRGPGTSPPGGQAACAPSFFMHSPDTGLRR